MRRNTSQCLSYSLANVNFYSCRNKHSSFSSTFPIYLFTQYEDEVPDEDEATTPNEDALEADIAEESESPASETSAAGDVDEDEVLVEDITEDSDKDAPESKKAKTKTVLVDEWMNLNPLPPIWLR